MFKIVWQPKSVRQLEKLKNNADQQSIRHAVFKLADFSNSKNVKALKNHKYGYRLRVGRYRVLFDVDHQIEIIEIQEVKKRDEHTY